ncbi:glycosyltransferase family 2 protein [Haladaptatus halobius]|uniref:glycosyltransferase family 2 protein n=1 Tax=Haladaptatus halobius TaxID=2884875 RepID=UPI001D0B674B|nr:glycosyltransferase family 2 protein [Haladaptatus halobius]
MTFEHRENETTADSRHDRPAVGVVATETNAGAIARAVLRAWRHGYAVLVVGACDSDSESVRIAHQLGCHVLARAEGEPETRLVGFARELGFPGVIIHRNPANRIDFDRSVATLRNANAYAVDASTIPRTASGVLVGIPAYEEAATIGEVVSRVRVHASAVLVVDDGSSDETGERARAAGAEVIRNDRNRGYGAALQTLFREAKNRGADHLVVLDGDGQHDPDDVPKLVEKQRETGAELVIGSRFAEDTESDVPSYRRIGLQVVNVLTNLSLGVVRADSWVRDTQSGFRAYDARFVETLTEDELLGDSMDASTDILYHAQRHGYGTETVGTEIKYDTGESSLNPVQHGVILVGNILRTVEREHPLTILGVPGFFGAFVGLGFGYWTFTNYIQTETFPLGLAITSALFLLAGIFSCFTAIVLHSLDAHLGGRG